MIQRAFLTVVSSLAVVGAILPAAWAQIYPTKPIRMLVGFPPAGAADIMARIVGQKLGESFQQQTVVDNRTGAGATIAAEIAAKAAPDGYTLLMVSSSYATSAGYYKLRYDPVKDLAAVALVASGPNVLIANPSFAGQSIAELIKMARAMPGKLNYASAGSGSITHLAAELFKSMANVNLTHVPYKGAAPALIDVISGQVPMQFSSLPAALAHIKAGRVKAIAVTSTQRSPALPEIPTVAESGVAGYEAANWFGVLAPAATSTQIIGKLNAEIQQALRTADVATAISRQGAEARGGTPGEFGSYVASEIAKWTRVIRDAGIRSD